MIEDTPNIERTLQDIEDAVGKGILTTRGFFPTDVAKKLISLGLAKKVNLEQKNIFQLKKLAKRHVALRPVIKAELEERSTRVQRLKDLRAAISKIKEQQQNEEQNGKLPNS
jgi:hypothetical protein